MEIRKLKPEENVHRILMSSICFTANAPEDRYPILQEPEKHTGGHENAWGAFDETGKLLSAMYVPFTQMMMHGQPVKIGQICGVTTLPEARNSRCVRKMFDVVMPMMKDEGAIFSYLYPFSHPFYRKFGYEHTFTRYKAKFPMSELSRYTYPNGIKVYDKGDPWHDIAKVYATFTKDKNQPLARGDAQWKGLLNRDPHKNRQFTYVHYNATGQPDAYIMYDGAYPDTPIHIKIRELAWTNKEGLYAMLGFVYGLRSEYDTVIWQLPGGLDIFGVVENANLVEISVDTMAMGRIMDVPAALNLIKPPATNSGSVAISINDSFMPCNTGTYSISWENGQLSAEKSVAPQADAEMDVMTLAQLVTGYTNISQAQHRRDVTIHSKFDELSAIFTQKNIYLLEHF